LSVRTYPSLGGSTISANLPYVFLVSCRVSSGRPLLDEGAASWESDGVDIDRNTLSGSDTEACNMLAWFTRMITLRVFRLVSSQGCWYYIPPHDSESIQTRRRYGRQALVFRRCNNTHWVSVSRAHIEVQEFQNFARHIQNYSISIFLLYHLSEYKVQNHHA